MKSFGDFGATHGRAKFKATARKCNHLKGKAKRKACWRRAYGKRR